MIAALFVEREGAYWNLDGVDPWDEARDARTYAGPWPVVAHPPCSAWSRTAPWRESMHGLPAFEDGGCFEAARAAVRRWGGVLEHPASSFAYNGIPFAPGGEGTCSKCSRAANAVTGPVPPGIRA